jgi:hypothetical protein
MLAWRNRFLDSRVCAIGHHGATHRARYPGEAQLTSEAAQTERKALALRAWTASCLTETGHTRSRQEVRGCRDAGHPPSVERLAARIMLRDAFTKAQALVDRTADPSTVGSAKSRKAGRAGGAAPVAAAPPRRRPRGSWPFRVFMSRVNVTAPTRPAYRVKVIRNPVYVCEPTSV